MRTLETIFSSNIPLDCRILQGRLSADGVDTYIYDENVVYVDPFKAIAVGGVKLKVRASQAERAERILDLLKEGKLLDEKGEYEMASVFEKEIERQNEILRIKSKIRKDPQVLKNPGGINSSLLSISEIEVLIEEEKEYQELEEIEHSFNWKQFWYEFFDFDRRVFKYLHPKPVGFYIEKDLVEYFEQPAPSKKTFVCPKCKSENVSYGYTIDNNWQILYIPLSFLFLSPFPPIRKNHHCFACGHNF